MISPKAPDTDTQKHLLRHFSWIPETYRIKITKTSAISSKDIERFLSFPGSKFFPEFASDPEQLWERIQAALESSRDIKMHYDDEKLRLELFFSKEDHPGGIGSDGLVRIDTLNQQEKQSLKKHDRDGRQVWAIERKEALISHSLQIIYHKDTGNIISIFPGSWAPPLPHNKMPSDRKKASEEFWEKHALILIKK